MSDEMLDNIDIDLSNVPLSRPVLDNQVVLCRTGEVHVERTGAEKKGPRRLVIPLTTEEPATATDGRPVAPGFVTTVGFLVDASGGWTQDRANESLGKFKAAVLKLDKLEGGFGSVEPLRGQLVKVHFVAQRNDPSRQDVKAWLKA